LILGGVLVIGLGLWLFRRPGVTAETVQALEPPPGNTTLLVEVAESAPARPTHPAEHPELSADGVPIMAFGSKDNSRAGPRHPHPITPEHLRILRENSLIEALNGAMDAGDYLALRSMNQNYRKQYPEDANRLQDGYDLIAACLERRTLQTEARARRFFDQERASILRRYVRRHCLE
jgi:hypothetical protein